MPQDEGPMPITAMNAHLLIDYDASSHTASTAEGYSLSVKAPQTPGIPTGKHQ